VANRKHLGGFKSRATVRLRLISAAITGVSGHLDRLRGEGGVVRRREAVVEVFFFLGVSARFHLFSPTPGLTLSSLVHWSHRACRYALLVTRTAP
jgi:hypothetical protein